MRYEESLVLTPQAGAFIRGSQALADGTIWGSSSRLLVEFLLEHYELYAHTSTLEGLLGDHPLWPHLSKILQDGAEFPLQPLSDEDRMTDLSFHMNRGNHKSLSKYASFIEPVILEDVDRGFALPLPIDILQNLPKPSVAPLGCHKQSILNDSGEIIPKYRLTHDQSFPGPSGLSVNLRVKKDELPPVMYSFALLRVIHFIVHTSSLFPSTKIYLCKVDLDATYRRYHISSSTCFESMTNFDGLLLVALQLTFGGSPCPGLWGIISESITDITNTLLQNPFWDHDLVFDPISESLYPPLNLPDSVIYHLEKDLAVSLPTNSLGYVDIIIDDSIGIIPDLGDNATWMRRAIPLAICTMTRPLDHNDVIPRKDIISMKKYQAVGRLEEEKKVLGWNINTRSLRISLPYDKFQDWSKDIRQLISAISYWNLSLAG